MVLCACAQYGVQFPRVLKLFFELLLVISISKLCLNLMLLPFVVFLAQLILIWSNPMFPNIFELRKRVISRPLWVFLHMRAHDFFVTGAYFILLIDQSINYQNNRPVQKIVVVRMFKYTHKSRLLTYFRSPKTLGNIVFDQIKIICAKKTAKLRWVWNSTFPLPSLDKFITYNLPKTCDR